ncbi:MAG: tol-pal system protein YbgF [Candidatus Accumulibacter sp.]|jgi:tol-pal system protein YbgF|nr:tol-pal system protein YbgF [Accumulibacter sp.]
MLARCFRPAILALALLAVCATPPARAGLFDDDEARQQVNELTLKFNERVDTLSRAQMDLLNQIQSLREENAKLRGQVETLQYELESATKRQKDFYGDLDGRLRKFETAASSAETPESGDGDVSSSGAADPAAAGSGAETRAYEAALNLFRANKIKDSAAAFAAFVTAYPDSALAPNAYYWQGNALTAQRDCKRAIDVYLVVIASWPENPRAADALVGVASCQQELGDARSARATLESVLTKYPNSSAAATAKQRLKK